MPGLPCQSLPEKTHSESPLTTRYAYQEKNKLTVFTHRDYFGELNHQDFVFGKHDDRWFSPQVEFLAWFPLKIPQHRHDAFRERNIFLPFPNFGKAVSLRTAVPMFFRDALRGGRGMGKSYQTTQSVSK